MFLMLYEWKKKARIVAQDVKSLGCDVKTSVCGSKGEGGVLSRRALVRVRDQRHELQRKAARRVTALSHPPPPATVAESCPFW